MSIQDVIAAAGDRLTPTDRRIAAAVVDNPTLLAFGTVSDLADHVATSRPSIVRFANRLGFDGYSDLQASAREQVARQLSSPSHRIRRRQTMPSARTLISDAIEVVFEALDETRVASIVQPLVEADRVWVISGETSMAGAHTLFSGLSMLRPDVRLVVEQSVGRDLAGAGASDAAIVFDFARYRRHSITAARSLAEMGVRVVAITDGPLSPLASLSQAWAHLSIPALGPFDSPVPAVVAADLIVARAATLLGEVARERIDRLEGLWKETGTFVEG